MRKPVKFGDYYLFERIAVGGMAEVYKGVSYGVEGFERLFAVKRVLPNIAEDHEFTEMFIDEAKIAVQLHHANIGQVFDLGQVEDAYYIAMEFVQGKDGRAIFDNGRDRGEHLPIPMACHIIIQVCEALEYAHNRKNERGESLDLIHRDVSPQNIIVSYEGEVKLIDFGIAKAAGKASKTQAGILKGKFSYMSPEQVRGKPIDRRSDIFAVSVCLYELLTLERCFSGESDFSTLEKVREADYRTPTQLNRDIPPELERILVQGLARDPEKRYQSAGEMQEALQRFLYQSGAFYGRKDLANYMQRTFARDIESEQQALAGFRDYARANIPEARRDEPLPAQAVSVVHELDEADLLDDMPEADWGQTSDEEQATEVYDRDPHELPPEILPQFDAGDGATTPASGMPAMGAQQVLAQPATLGYGQGPAAYGMAPSGAQPAPSGGYPQQTGGYPQQGYAGGPGSAGGGYPSTGAYPGQPGGHPTTTGYPQQTGGHPQQTGGHPQQTGGYPQQSGGYPQQTGGYGTPGTAPYGAAGAGAHPAMSGAYGAASGAHPAMSGAHPAMSGAHPAMSGAHPAMSGAYQTHDVNTGPAVPHAPVGRGDTVPGSIATRSELYLENQNSTSKRLWVVLVIALLAAAGAGAALLLLDRVELASLTIETQPSQVEVYLDGKLMHEAETPITVQNLSPGEHAVRVIAPGYEPSERTVVLDEGEERKLSFELAAQVKQTRLQIESEPGGAAVYVDGKLRDQTPVTIDDISAGEHEVKLEKSGYQPWTGKVRLEEGRTNKMEPIQLYPTDVTVTFLTEPAEANVRIEIRMADGSSRTLPEGALRATGLPNDGSTTVVMSAEGYENLERTLPRYRQAEVSEVMTLTKAEVRKPRVRRTRPARRDRPRPAPPAAPAAPVGEPGFLNVMAKPPAQAKVRGKNLGWTPVLKHELPPGRYTVELVRDQEPTYRAKVKVTIKSGETTLGKYIHR